MSLTMSRRALGDVTIFDMGGRITLGEGSRTLSEKVREELRQGRRNLILNLQELSYMDSSGIQELTSAFTNATSQGGDLKLLNPSKKIRDLLQITKLYTVFEVFDDEALAVRSFQVAMEYCLCPLCKHQARPPRVEGGQWDSQSCPYCSTSFTVTPAEDQTLLVTSAKLRTFENEYLQVYPGAPFTVKVVGRMELFVSTALSKVWRAIPPPRRILFDLSQVTEAGQAGVEALRDVLAGKKPEDLAAVSLEGLSPNLVDAFNCAPEFFATKADALRALGNLTVTTKWISRFDRFKRGRET